MPAPEYSTVYTFVQFLVDDERSVFSHEDLSQLNEATRRPTHSLRVELEGWGFTLANRPFDRRVRGFTSNPHDRWYGPGSCPTHGGAAYDKMMTEKYGDKDAFGG